MNDIVYSDGYREVRRSGDPTAGGAYANYIVLDSKFPLNKISNWGTQSLHSVQFQNDVISRGLRGVTNECLLAMVIDRLECFQNSDFACEDNENALVATSEALQHLENRTTDRKNREVEGKNEL